MQWHCMENLMNDFSFDYVWMAFLEVLKIAIQFYIVILQYKDDEYYYHKHELYNKS